MPADPLTDLIYKAAPRADPAPIAAAVRSYLAELLDAEERKDRYADDRWVGGARSAITSLRTTLLAADVMPSPSATLASEPGQPGAGSAGDGQ